MVSILGGKQGVDSPSKTPKTTILHFDFRGFLGGPLLVVLLYKYIEGKYDNRLRDKIDIVDSPTMV